MTQYWLFGRITSLTFCKSIDPGYQLARATGLLIDLDSITSTWHLDVAATAAPGTLRGGGGSPSQILGTVYMRQFLVRAYTRPRLSNRAMVTPYLNE